MGDGEGHRERADGGGRAENQETKLADVENILGEDGEQECRAAEQDGEEIECDGGEDDLLGRGQI